MKFLIAAALFTSFVSSQESLDIGEPLTLPELISGKIQTSEDPDKSASILQSELCLSQHNAARAQFGLVPFRADARLETAARNHNSVMVSRNCFDHQCPGEPNFADRISSAGYAWSFVGENIIAGSNTADCNAAVNGWMNSDGHKKNILNNFVHIGCHMQVCSSGCNFRYYWTCNFGRPR